MRDGAYLAEAVERGRRRARGAVDISGPFRVILRHMMQTVSKPDPRSSRGRHADRRSGTSKCHGCGRPVSANRDDKKCLECVLQFTMADLRARAVPFDEAALRRDARAILAQ